MPPPWLYLSCRHPLLVVFAAVAQATGLVTVSREQQSTACRLKTEDDWDADIAVAGPSHFRSRSSVTEPARDRERDRVASNTVYVMQLRQECWVCSFGVLRAWLRTSHHYCGDGAAGTCLHPLMRIVEELATDDAESTERARKLNSWTSDIVANFFHMVGGGMTPPLSAVCRQGKVDLFWNRLSGPRHSERLGLIFDFP